MTSLWSTPRAGCWHAAASATTRPATSSCCSYWPRLATPPPSPSRSPSRPAAACWWPSCAPPAGACTPSTPGRVPLPGSARCGRLQVRPRRRGRAGRHPAHRRGRAPAPAGGLRTGPGDRSAGPRSAGRGLESPAAGQPAALAAAGVLPRRPGGLPPQARRPDRPRGPRRAGRRANPHPGGQSDHRTAAPPAALRWSPAQPRRLDQAAAASFHADQPRQLPLVEQAMGQQVLALLAQLQAACQAADDLAEATVAQFRRHPDYQIITSFPGLGELTGARVLAELGDDRSRFADARGVKAYAGAAPVTRASGKRLQVLARKVKNQRLAAVGYVWAFAALTASPGARAHYDRRKHAGDRHAAAQRNLFNRLLGMLHHCLATRQTYSEAKAFPAPEALAA